MSPSGVDDKRTTLPTFVNPCVHSSDTPRRQARVVNWSTLTAFLAGILVALTGVWQYGKLDTSCTTRNALNAFLFGDVVPGTPEWHDYPPTDPSNAVPSMFPSNVGYPGPTHAGAEPGVAATAPAYPIHSGSAQLVVPHKFPKGKGKGQAKVDGEKKKHKFDLLRSWASLSPWYSVEQGTFGIDSSPEVPDTCRVTGVHLLHRHGARGPLGEATSGPPGFASRLRALDGKFTASGPLEFLEDWTYKLGSEGLTPFGRAQLFDLGVSMRMRYGFLLKNFTDSNIIPVFRTESQNRMVASAQNFALGFFGYPLEGEYQQVIMIEAPGFNNTLAPYSTCKNSDDPNRGWRRGFRFMAEWENIYLQKAVQRLQKHIKGVKLTVADVFAMQEMCAYETVGLGYSKFCELFTVKEWEGFHYAYDIMFWYSQGFGSPLAKALGIGYVQELVSRLTQTPIKVYDSTTNATLHNDIQFPLGHSLYVDATHEVVVMNVLVALGLQGFATTGPLPLDHIPENRSFKSSELLPFSTNVQFQLLSCDSEEDPQIRVIVNDAVVPLDVLEGCPENAHGMCSVDAFVAAQQETIKNTNWSLICNGDWEVPKGWNSTSGYPDWL